MNDKKTGAVLITFSDNYDHQEAAFSLFNELYLEYNVYNIGIKNQKYQAAPKTENSFYYNCPKRPGIGKGTFNFFELFKIVKKINSLNVKYVYFESSHIWNAFIMFFIKKSFTKIQLIHDVIPHSDSKGMKLCNKVTCRLADKIAIKNEKYKQDLCDIYKIKPENIICLPVWRYFPEERPANIQTSFLFFGRIRKYKGIETLIKIIRLCPEIMFTVVGESDEENQIYVDELKTLNNVEVIAREVTDEEMEDYFTKTSCVILPYSSATQSGVIIDAYKFSRPVIAFDVGAISEQVENGKSGFLIPENDIDGFADKIKQYAELDDDTKSKFCQDAYSFGYEKNSVQRVKDTFIKELNNLE